MGASVLEGGVTSSFLSSFLAVASSAGAVGEEEEVLEVDRGVRKEAMAELYSGLLVHLASEDRLR